MQIIFKAKSNLFLDRLQKLFNAAELILISPQKKQKEKNVNLTFIFLLSGEQSSSNET